MGTHPIALESQNFSQEVLASEGVILVDFWAPWCGPCQAMAPRLDELAEKYAEHKQVKIAKLDVDNNQDIAEKYQIMSIPTLAIFHKGQEIKRLTGMANLQVLEGAIQQALQEIK